MTNKISTVLDLDDRSFTRTLKGIGTSVRDADGALNKFKAGSKATFDGLKQYSAEAAVAAGAALVAFGIKAVSAFQSTALEAGKFSDAAGIAVDDASRWIEVAGDLGIAPEAVEGAIRRMNTAIAGDKLAEFADQIVRAKDGSVDASASFVNVATSIGAIKDPTERARAAQTAFGKSYSAIAELMASDAKSLRGALDDVSDAKVIDQQELRRAREMREAIDNLKDRFEDFALRLGGAVVPALTETADALGPVLDGVGALARAIDGIEQVDGGGGFFGNLVDQTKWFAENIREGKSPAEAFGNETLPAIADAASEAAAAIDTADRSQQDFSEDLAASSTAWTTAEEAAAEYYLSVESAKHATEDFGAAYAALTGKLDQDAAWENALNAMFAFRSSTTHSTGETRGYIKTLAELVVQLDGVPDEVRTEMLAKLNTGDVETVEAWLLEMSQQRPQILLIPSVDAGERDKTEAVLAQLARSRPATIVPQAGDYNYQRSASGTPSAAGGWTLVGEQGPELIPLEKGSPVANARQTRELFAGSAAAQPLIVNIDAKGAIGLSGPMVEQWVRRALDAHARRNGG